MTKRQWKRLSDLAQHSEGFTLKVLQDLLKKEWQFQERQARNGHG